jgi:hypothetical protein
MQHQIMDVRTGIFTRMAQAWNRMIRREERSYDPYEAKMVNRAIEEALREKA